MTALDAYFALIATCLAIPALLLIARLMVR